MWAALIEGNVSNLQLKQYANRPPVISELLGSFHCIKCGKDHVRIKTWEGQVQAAIPLLQLPANDQPVDVSELFAAHIDEAFDTRCTNINCRQRITGARLHARAGFFTILAVNRFDVENPNTKRLNKLEMPINSNRIGEDLLGDLVCVVCHRGSVNHGHFVSYHKMADDQWFLNDDSRPCAPSENPLEGRNISENETIDLLFFKNNVIS